MTFGTEPLRQAITGVPVGHGFDHDETKRFAQEGRCDGIAETGFVITFADEFDERVIEKRLNHMLEIFLIGGVDLAAIFKGMPARLAISILGPDAFQGQCDREREIAATLLVEPIEGCRQSVIDRRHPIQ